MAETALANRDENAIVVGNLTRKQVGLIKRTIAQGYTDDELMLFLFAAERKGLDPLSREIHTFKDKQGRIQIITGIDGFRSRADATGRYMPGREPTFEMGPDGKPISATSYIQRWDERSAKWFEVAATAWFDEQERSSPAWGKMPRVMLAKCAEAIGHRRAFPAELGGIYIKEEMAVPVQTQRVTPADLPPEAEERLRTSTAPAPQTTEPEAAEAEYVEVPAETSTETVKTCGEDPKGEGRRTKCKAGGGYYYGKNLVDGICPNCRPPETAKAPAASAADPMAQASCSACGEVLYAAQINADGLCARCAQAANQEANPEPKPPTPPAKPATPGAPKTAPRDRFVAVLQDGIREGKMDPNVILDKVMKNFPGLAESDHKGDYSPWTEELADEAIELLYKYSGQK